MAKTVKITPEMTVREINVKYPAVPGGFQPSRDGRVRRSVRTAGTDRLLREGA